MIRRYLREHLPLAGLLALFAGTFALVLSLYHLPTEPVAYASALCAVMGLIALIWGFVRYRRAHQARAHVLNAPHLLLDELPSPRTLSEADDQAIMQRLLHDVRAAQSDLAAYRQDSTDYFTAWVHQIKTPLSVMRLQLQSEDTPENRAMLAELFQMEQYVTMALSYARLGNPTKDLVLTRVPLDPLIRQAIRDFAPLLIRKKLRLQYEPTAESALTDSKWLLFILHQLLSNAVKYTERGRVSIRVTSAPAIIVAGRNPPDWGCISSIRPLKCSIAVCRCPLALGRAQASPLICIRRNWGRSEVLSCRFCPLFARFSPAF
ncbi:MAG: HAMP domain-containing sensor histidine kinase [Christensenellales bacterium]|nr:HAMP domain-containing sensor histidine kinase [Christensenellales bacterium]